MLLTSIGLFQHSKRLSAAVKLSQASIQIDQVIVLEAVHIELYLRSPAYRYSLTLKKRKDLKSLFCADISTVAGSLEADRVVNHGTGSGSTIIGSSKTGHSKETMNVAVPAVVFDMCSKQWNVNMNRIRAARNALFIEAHDIYWDADGFHS
eukprot:IDg18224t1